MPPWLQPLPQDSQLWQVLLATISEGVLITEANDDELDGRILYVNPAFEQMTGWDRGAIVGQTMALLYGPLTDQHQLDHMRQARREQRTIRSEVIYYRRDGRPLWVAVVITPVQDGQHCCTCTLTAQRDISVQKVAETTGLHLERTLLENQRLERLQGLAYNVLHDVNNLLAAIQANTELALLSLDDPQVRAYSLTQVLVGVRQGAELITQTRNDMRCLQQRMQPVLLNELVAEMLALLANTRTRHCTVQFHPQANVPPFLGNPVQVRQVLLNLVVNAAEAIGPEGGAINLSTHLESFEDPEQLAVGLRRTVRLTITDTGCGMDEATQQQMFVPMFSTKSTGQGLGLAIVQSIIAEHGGTAQVQSRPGQGTTVSVWFPLE
ncbi:MAG: ATP-binding protein [Chloroflexaceae bacterium]|nr:ATP-binding protein [Chloroflexaceae bacterium]